MAIRISAIVAMAQNRVIGKDGTMCWHIPEETRYFKQKTLGHPVIMGRTSFEALGSKPLKNRPNIILSRSYTPHRETINDTAVIYCNDLEDAKNEAIREAEKCGAEEIFITGGEQIYRAYLPVTDRIYLTIIEREYEGDTFFPEFDRNEWIETAAEKHEGDPAYTIYTLDRR